MRAAWLHRSGSAGGCLSALQCTHQVMMDTSLWGKVEQSHVRICSHAMAITSVRLCLLSCNIKEQWCPVDAVRLGECCHEADMESGLVQALKQRLPTQSLHRRLPAQRQSLPPAQHLSPPQQRYVPLQSISSILWHSCCLIFKSVPHTCFETDPSLSAEAGRQTAKFYMQQALSCSKSSDLCKWEQEFLPE